MTAGVCVFSLQVAGKDEGTMPAPTADGVLAAMARGCARCALEERVAADARPAADEGENVRRNERCVAQTRGRRGCARFIRHVAHAPSGILHAAAAARQQLKQGRAPSHARAAALPADGPAGAHRKERRSTRSASQRSKRRCRLLWRRGCRRCSRWERRARHRRPPPSPHPYQSPRR